jgi:hypothetical protein
MNLDRIPDLLFNEYDLRELLERQRPNVKAAVDNIPESRLLRESEEALVEEIRAASVLERLELSEDEISVEREEVKIDVSQDRYRVIHDRSRPFHVDGLRVIYYLPYRGDAAFLRARPSSYTFNPPRAVRGNDELLFLYERTDGDIDATRVEFDRDLATVRQWIAWVNAQVDEYNAALPAVIHPLVSTRRSRLAESDEKLGSLGFKVRQKQVPPERAETAPPRPSTPKSGATKSAASAAESEGPEFDVAFSYASENLDYVDRVATLLRTHDVKVWFDRQQEVDMWGHNLADHFADIFTKRARYIVMFVSEHYARKAWPTYERQQAQARAITSKEVVILPVRFDDTDIPGLSGVAYLDARKLTPAALSKKIEEKVRR